MGFYHSTNLEALPAERVLAGQDLRGRIQALKAHGTFQKIVQCLFVHFVDLQQVSEWDYSYICTVTYDHHVLHIALFKMSQDHV